MPRWQYTDAAWAAARAESAAPCTVNIWRAAGQTMHYVVDDAHIATHDDYEPLEARIIDPGEGAYSPPAWFEEAARG